MINKGIDFGDIHVPRLEGNSMDEEEYNMEDEELEKGSDLDRVRAILAGEGEGIDEIDQLIEMEWIRFGRRRMTPGRPVTFVVTEIFLDHFGLESARDLPGLKDLRAAGLLDNRPLPGAALTSDEDEDQTGQSELFED